MYVERDIPVNLRRVSTQWSHVDLRSSGRCPNIWFLRRQMHSRL
jgi:hypothetical protein